MALPIANIMGACIPTNQNFRFSKVEFIVEKKIPNPIETKKVK